jgi:hypothetical protein
MGHARSPRLGMPMLHGQGESLMAIQVFFDESGHVADHPHVVFGGCVASSEAALAIGERWESTLKEYGLESISMKDAMGLHGNLRTWRTSGSRKEREDARDVLVLRLVKEAILNVKFFVSCIVTTEDFKGLPEKQRKALKDPEYMGFEGCMLQVMSHEDAQDPIQICYDNAEEYAIEVLKLYKRMRVLNPEFKKRCANLTFAEDQFFAALQLADVYAYCIRESHRPDRELKPLVRKLLAIMEPDGPTDIGFTYHANGALGQGVLID